MAQKMTRDEYRKKKEIEEARKAGTLPPERDNEGNMINPHIPEYMSKAPWYLNQSAGEGLKHQKQRLVKHYETLNKVNQRGFTKRAKIFRKGACRNCGSMTHKTKDCLDRPRKVGAWKTGMDIKPDEIIPEKLSLTFDGKRDRWSGYDNSMHALTIKRYQNMSEARKKRKVAKQDARFKLNQDQAKRRKQSGNNSQSDGSATDTDIGSDSDTDSDAESDDDDDDVRLRDSNEMNVGAKLMRINTGSKSSIRNLRIREDLPKYLRNLDVNSAHYDAKTRSMRANPNPHIDPKDATYCGDNFVRTTGDAKNLARSQLYVWEAYGNGTNVNLLADPTTAELMQKQHAERKAKLERSSRNTILDRYDPKRQLNSNKDKALLAAVETEQYYEYHKDGRVKKGAPELVPKTKYEEDVLTLNHTSVWGSWFNIKTMTWGYACCHQQTKNSVCTGEAGKAAQAASDSMRGQALQKLADKRAAETKSSLPATAEEVRDLMAKSSALYGEATEANTADLDPEKLKEALRKAKRRAKGKLAESDSLSNSKRRKYNSLKEEQVTAEDMEAYRRVKVRHDDPMAKFIDDDSDDEDRQGDTSVILQSNQKTERKKQKKKKKKV